MNYEKSTSARYSKVVMGLRGWDNEHTFYVKDASSVEEAEQRAMAAMRELNLLGVYPDDWYVKEYSLCGFPEAYTQWFI